MAMRASASQLTDVADTALWIAAYRAQETVREHALFRDPLAARLAGVRGAAIAEHMTGAEQFSWMTSVRTVVADELVLGAIRHGAGTVLNLGAGLDTRPYRLALPASVRWIEVDVPKIIEHKNTLLRGERPRCDLARISADLSDAAARRDVLARVGDIDHDVLVLTEGVLAYLTERDVAALADDLHRQPRFRAWIVDFAARFLSIAVHLRRLHRADSKNAPVRFSRDDWPAFYQAHGWKLAEQRHLPIEGERLGRPLPMPWWLSPVHAVLPAKAREAIRSMIGFARLERA